MYKTTVIDEWLNGHILIAGTTGSGKSVLLDNIILNISATDARNNKIVLIDPKRVSFQKWKALPHILKYSNEKAIATEKEEITSALWAMVDIMEQRYKMLEQMDIEKVTDCPIYIIIDELANVLLDKANEEPLYKLLTLGRASCIFVIGATQNPSRKVLSGKLQCCFEGCRIGLHCSKHESRMIVNDTICDTLPKFGYCIALQDGYMTKVKVPYLDREIINEQIKAVTG